MVHIVVCVSGEREENMCILEEAAAIKYVCKQLVLIGQQGGGGSGGEAADKKEVVVVLLAELLLEQDREVAAILNKLPHMVRDEICILGRGLQSQSFARAINPFAAWWLIWPIQNDAKNLKTDWNPGIWVLIWESSARAILWIPTWQGLDGFQKSLRSCALDERSLSIGRVKEIQLLCELEEPLKTFISLSIVIYIYKNSFSYFMSELLYEKLWNRFCRESWS